MLSQEGPNQTPPTEHYVPFPPGYLSFLKNYQQVRQLSPAARGNLILHDLSDNFTTPLVGIVTYYDSVRKNTFFNKIVPDDNRLPMQKITYFEEMLKLDFNSLTSDNPGFDTYAKDVIDKKLKPLYACFPLLKASITFLESPTPEKLAVLQETEVRASDLLSLNGIQPDSFTDFSVQGPKAVMLLNLLSNAKRHASDPNSIRISQESGTITVSNLSDHQIDTEQIFKLGTEKEKSEQISNTSNTGYGLFIAQHLYGPLANASIEASSKPKEDSIHEVTFSITSK